MKNIFYVLILCILFSCHNEKVIQLAEINNTDINEILDISPAYLFYDETKPDSLELNRKNLISTTNWLVNVDKRLTLEQAIPQIIFLQNKKKNFSHKKEGVKNYYTCNNTSIKNLGFIEFTDVVYKTYNDAIDETINPNDRSYHLNIVVKSSDSILVLLESSHFYSKIQTNNTLIKKLKSEIESLKKFSDDPDHGFDNIMMKFSFNRNLTFQDYISIKSLFINFKTENTMISKDEYIY